MFDDNFFQVEGSNLPVCFCQMVAGFRNCLLPAAPAKNNLIKLPTFTPPKE